MVSSGNAGLQRIIESLNKTSNDYGMKINIKKTKVESTSNWKKENDRDKRSQSGTSATVYVFRECDQRRLQMSRGSETSNSHWKRSIQ